jgi:hypothetical protein
LGVYTDVKVIVLVCHRSMWSVQWGLWELGTLFERWGREGNAGVSKVRLAGYDLVKSIGELVFLALELVLIASVIQGKAITTRRTRNVVASTLTLLPPSSEAPHEPDIQSKSTSTTPAMPPSRKLGPIDFMPPIPPPPSTAATYKYTVDGELELDEAKSNAVEESTPPEPKEEFGA